MWITKAYTVGLLLFFSCSREPRDSRSADILLLSEPRFSPLRQDEAVERLIVTSSSLFQVRATAGRWAIWESSDDGSTWTRKVSIDPGIAYDYDASGSDFHIMKIEGDRLLHSDLDISGRGKETLIVESLDGTVTRPFLLCAGRQRIGLAWIYTSCG